MDETQKATRRNRTIEPANLHQKKKNTRRPCDAQLVAVRWLSAGHSFRFLRRRGRDRFRVQSAPCRALQNPPRTPAPGKIAKVGKETTTKAVISRDNSQGGAACSWTKRAPLPRRRRTTAATCGCLHPGGTAAASCASLPNPNTAAEAGRQQTNIHVRHSQTDTDRRGHKHTAAAKRTFPPSNTDDHRTGPQSPTAGESTLPKAVTRGSSHQTGPSGKKRGRRRLRQRTSDLETLPSLARLPSPGFLVCPDRTDHISFLSSAFSSSFFLPRLLPPRSSSG